MIKRHARFLLATGFTCLICLVGPYLAITSNALYCRHSTVFWNSIDCFKFSLRGQSADVVFVGDSSLVFGVRPNLLKQQINLSAFNLGQPAGGMIFFPGLLLNKYLKRNSRPHLIVLYVGPWTLVDNQKDIGFLWDDGARVALRHGNSAQLARVFEGDPTRLVQVPMLVMEQGLQQFSFSRKWWRHASAELQAERGWFPAWRPDRPFAISRPGGGHAIPQRLPDECTLSVKPVGAPDLAKIQRFRDTYQHEGTRVIVYIAPVPQCDPDYTAIVSAYAGISDNRPQTLPNRDFIDDGWRVHVTRKGANQATDQVADFIKSYIVLHTKLPAVERQRVANGRS